MTNLYRTFQETWADRVQAPCVVTDNATLCFADLDARAGVFAEVLRGGAQLAPGEIVMAVLRKSPDALALYLACLRAGAIYFPANPAYTAHELTYLATDAAPSVLVLDPSLTDLGEGIRQQVPSARRLYTLGTSADGTLSEEAATATPVDDTLPRGPDDGAALLYTSGTTGQPKGVPLSHGNLLHNARALVRTWRFGSEDRLVHALPIFHVHGLFVALHCALLSGASVRWFDRFDAARVRDALGDASVLMGVPTYYARLLALEHFDARHVASVRLFVSGSAPLSEKLFQAFEARTGHRILERYGMTETGMIASNPYSGERLAGTVGYALDGVEVRVRDEEGQSVAPGVHGAIEVRGPSVFTGYHQRPDANAREFTADGWFRTGDLGYLDVDGRLTLAGRARDLIISGGFNVYPAEVESALDALPGVSEAAVIGVPHHDLGEAVVAVIVANNPAQPPDAKALLTALGERLARYKQPRRVVIVDALPRNAMGKVRKQKLREQLAHSVDSDAP